MKLPELADILSRTNQPMGSSTGRAIYAALAAGKIDEAKTVFHIDGDKLHQYEELNEWVTNNLGAVTK